MKNWRAIVGGFLILALSFMLFVAVMIGISKADTVKPRPNMIGAPTEVTNSWTYLLALPIDGQILEGKYTNIRFAPYAAPDLYDESVLFCGDVTYEFNGKTGVVVIVYRTQASRKYKGTACHELLNVFEVPTR